MEPQPTVTVDRNLGPLAGRKRSPALLFMPGRHRSELPGPAIDQVGRWGAEAIEQRIERLQISGFRRGLSARGCVVRGGLGLGKRGGSRRDQHRGRLPGTQFAPGNLLQRRFDLSKVDFDVSFLSGQRFVSARALIRKNAKFNGNVPADRAHQSRSRKSFPTRIERNNQILVWDRADKSA
jgi:hypothetical protein